MAHFLVWYVWHCFFVLSIKRVSDMYSACYDKLVLHDVFSLPKLISGTVVITSVLRTHFFDYSLDMVGKIYHKSCKILYLSVESTGWYQMVPPHDIQPFKKNWQSIPFWQNLNVIFSEMTQFHIVIQLVKASLYFEISSLWENAYTPN